MHLHGSPLGQGSRRDGTGWWEQAGAGAALGGRGDPALSPQHKYTSIAEVQVHMEEEYLRSPLSGVSVGMGWDEHPGLGVGGTWPCQVVWQG